MSSEQWYKMDNVAKVFLATYNKRDTRSLRVSATLKEEIKPDILQSALNETLESRPQFLVRIRRGIFWHYLERSDARAEVTLEEDRPCPLLYGSEYNGVLHFKVSYFGKRINLDLFHALSDGTGAMEFLQILVGNYLRLLYPNEVGEELAGSSASAGDLEENSFERFYDKKLKASAPTKKSYHVRGRRLPYNQLQFFEIRMNASEVLAKAKECNVSLTSYLGARWMMAVYQDMPLLKRKLPITISMPVNLRNFYPSETARNFFNNVNISHVFSGNETLEELAKEFDEKLKASLEPEKIKTQMNSYQKLEEILFVRMVPLFIKMPVVRYFSKAENKRVSVVLSNLGVIKPSEKIGPFVDSYSAFCSHNEIFSTVLSYGGELCLGVTYAYNDTAVLKRLVRGFSEEGIAVKINATEVIKS